MPRTGETDIEFCASFSDAILTVDLHRSCTGRLVSITGQILSPDDDETRINREPSWLS